MHNVGTMHYPRMDYLIIRWVNWLTDACVGEGHDDKQHIHKRGWNTHLDEINETHRVFLANSLLHHCSYETITCACCSIGEIYIIEFNRQNE